MKFFILLSVASNCLIALEVTTTIPTLHFLVSEITEGVLIPNLITTNSSPHNYQLTPKNAYSLQNSDVVFYVGKEFEIFAKKNNSKNWVELLPMMPNFIKKNNGQKDVHMWLSPENAKEIVKIVTEILSRKDKNHADTYHENARFLIERIDISIKLITFFLADLPKKQYVAMHNAYEYFTDYFGLLPVIKLMETDHGVIGIKEIRKIENIAKNDGLACIISDPNHRIKLPDNVLKSIKLVTIDPLGKNNNTYTEFLYTVAKGFFECFN
ncbi:MAG: zinc ABC transporter substrate-binding protein [Rickettsiaceae bacterium H1]|nr:zinc ABC transporter substrate-binding protein [Rickettsiaceae bacterium H1]